MRFNNTSQEIVNTPSEAVRNVNEMVLSKNIADALCKRWPIEKGHRWGVHVDGHGGVCNIYNLSLSAKWGFTLKLVQIINDPTFKAAINAAGEILERYNIKRSKTNHIRDDIRGLQKDFTGEFMFDGADALKHGNRVYNSLTTHKQYKNLPDRGQVARLRAENPNMVFM